MSVGSSTSGAMSFVAVEVGAAIDAGQANKQPPRPTFRRRCRFSNWHHRVAVRAPMGRSVPLFKTSAETRFLAARITLVVAGLIHAAEGLGRCAAVIAVDARMGQCLGPVRFVDSSHLFLNRYCQMFCAGILVRALRIAADQDRLLLHQPSLGVAFAGLVDAAGRAAQQRRADPSSVINCNLQILVQHEALSRTLGVKAVPQQHGKA